MAKAPTKSEITASESKPGGGGNPAASAKAGYISPPVMILSKREGFRRGGAAHAIEPKPWKAGSFSKEQFQGLLDEPLLIVKELPEDFAFEDPEIPEGSAGA